MSVKNVITNAQKGHQEHPEVVFNANAFLLEKSSSVISASILGYALIGEHGLDAALKVSEDSEPAGIAGLFGITLDERISIDSISVNCDSFEDVVSQLKPLCK